MSQTGVRSPLRFVRTKPDIAFYGGSFNPPHRGHFFLINYILKQTRLRKIILMPAFAPPHKLNEKMAPFRHRFAMLRLLLEEFGEVERSRIKLSTLEKRQSTPSYTFHTLKLLKKLCPGHKIKIILGKDMYDTLPSWYSYESLIEEYHFIVFKRIYKLSSERMPPKIVPRTKTSFLDNPLWNYSANEVRQLLEDHSLRNNDMIAQRIKNILPLKVLDYILKNNLY